jgi:site-specific recombinase XerD
LHTPLSTHHHLLDAHHSQEVSMTALRTRMLRDLTVRGLAPRTHKAYISAVARLAKHYHRSPDQITDDEVQTYLAHLVHDRKLSWSRCSQAANAFRFLYHVTLGRPRTEFVVPLPKQPQKLPEILSREEVWRLLAAPHTRATASSSPSSTRLASASAKRSRSRCRTSTPIA